MGLLRDALGPADLRDADRVVATCARGGLVDVVVRELAVRRVNDLFQEKSA